MLPGPIRAQRTFFIVQLSRLSFWLGTILLSDEEDNIQAVRLVSLILFDLCHADEEPYRCLHRNMNSNNNFAWLRARSGAAA
jgi:hypothetical protein